MSTSIIEIVEELLEKSEALLSLINQEVGHKDYEDAFIEKVNERLDARQVVIDRLQNASQGQELKTLIEGTIPKVTRERVLEIDKAITYGLEQIFNHIGQSRRLFQAKQRTQKQYRNPFASVERDGMFVDKRK